MCCLEINSNLGGITGSVSISTSTTTKVTLGFKPSQLIVHHKTNGIIKLISSYYNTIPDIVGRYGVDGYGEAYTIPQSQKNRIASIDSDGFTYNATSDSNARIEYIAYK